MQDLIAGVAALFFVGCIFWYGQSLSRIAKSSASTNELLDDISGELSQVSEHVETILKLLRTKQGN